MIKDSNKNKSENLVSRLASPSAMIPKPSEGSLTSRLPKAVLTESTSVTYSMSRPSPSSELSVTVCVAAGQSTEPAGHPSLTSEGDNITDISHSE